jgi:transposase
MERAVLADPDMARLQQIPGIRDIGAFILVAFVEDVHRFETPKKFVVYIGLNPSVCSSGEKEGRHALSHYGRKDLKTLFAEAAHTVLRAGSPLSRWAKRLLARGKPRNVAVCALAQKLALLCWYILMGHPRPRRRRQTGHQTQTPPPRAVYEII